MYVPYYFDKATQNCGDKICDESSVSSPIWNYQNISISKKKF